MNTPAPPLDIRWFPGLSHPVNPGTSLGRSLSPKDQRLPTRTRRAYVRRGSGRHAYRRRPRDAARNRVTLMPPDAEAAQGSLRRIVLKVGTSTLTGGGAVVDPRRIALVAEDVAATVRRGRQVLVVSSGAIVSGAGLL